VAAAVGLGVYALPERASAALQVLGTVVMVGLVVGVLASPEPLRAALGGWAAPLGIGLHADRLAQAMLVLTLLVYAAVLLYAKPTSRTAPSWRGAFGPWLGCCGRA